ncbi:ribonuclease inhibitor [Fibrella sp. HMF5335]|uniref:Ribonuclease inhibitor n=1 Tax=Fibrella rubiginis TaxID=2817060 RepID=A0A939K5V3_9BACT|nr:c-type cytochrome domain-containing protein [Fibrella rubiginis]MBO0938168.1 ribonuclease inhibitor [Fibrella rubiginis]
MNAFLLLQANPSDWALFFGHFHPLVVHLPIGFLLIAGLLEMGRRLGRISLSNSTMSAILFWSAVSATVSCVFGYLLSLGDGYDEEILTEHQWQGIGVAVFAWVAWAVSSDRFMNRIPFGNALYAPALVLTLVLLMAAGHHGGALTHGSDYLTQYTPEPFRSLAGLPPRAAAVAFKAEPITDVNQAMVYAQIVNPILQTRCVQCHNAEKSKGDLRMDTPAMLKKGGEDGPIFVAGKGTDSEMIKRCLLDEDDEHHMPPKGKTQLTDQQVTLLTWWIDQGASFDKKVADLTVNDAVKPALASLGGGDIKAGDKTLAVAGATPSAPRPVSPVLTMKMPVADPKVVEELKKTGLLVLPLSKENNQLEVSAVNVRTFTDAQAALLAKISTQLVWLKLSDTQVGDGAMASIAKLKNLQKLHLERTAITDAGLRQLTGLPYLEYLNLYGTAITDAGLTSLTGLKSLQTVYLWQTKTTEAGIANLKKALPNLEVVGGMSGNTVAAN